MTLNYWWHRWASFAFTPQVSVCHWWCQSDNDQVHLYREYVARNISAEQIGVILAKTSDPDQAKITVWTSPELFEPGAHKSIAQQISEGIQLEYGPNSAFLYMSTYEESGLATAEERVRALERRRHELRDLRATLQPIVEDEDAGWEHLRELLRSKPYENETPVLFDPMVARELNQLPDESRYAEYMAAVARKPVVLPKMLIHAQCQQAIRALAGASHPVKHPEPSTQVRETDVATRSVLYGVLAHRGGQVREPMEAYRARRLAAASEHTNDQARLFMVGEKASADWKKKNQQRRWRFPVINPRRKLVGL